MRRPGRSKLAGAAEGGPEGGSQSLFPRICSGDDPVRGDLPKIKILSVDYRTGQTGRGAEPENRRRRWLDRDTYAQRRRQRGRRHSGREHHSRARQAPFGRLDPDDLPLGVSAECSAD
ncbi:hypothetical protein GCM10009789_40050 [Kribbella sancticallisti]|uniref:Uncharacterized protein n=1 Tax=Kribbella sancticallisti TaxID=460087 RepID=A0ABN2DRY8_9ACTN